MRNLILKFDKKIGLFAFFSYGIIGGLSLALHFLVFGFFYSYLHVNYKIATTVSYIITILFNFSANRHITFKSHGNDLIRHLFRYFTMLLLNYVVMMCIFHVDVEWLGLSPYWALCVSAAVNAMTGFFLSRFWIYTPKSI